MFQKIKTKNSQLCRSQYMYTAVFYFINVSLSGSSSGTSILDVLSKMAEQLIAPKIGRSHMSQLHFFSSLRRHVLRVLIGGF